MLNFLQRLFTTRKGFEKKWGYPRPKSFEWTHEYSDILKPWLVKELPGIDITEVYTNNGELTVFWEGLGYGAASLIFSEDPATMQTRLFEAVDSIEEQFRNREVRQDKELKQTLATKLLIQELKEL